MRFWKDPLWFRARNSHGAAAVILGSGGHLQRHGLCDACREPSPKGNQARCVRCWQAGSHPHRTTSTLLASAQRACPSILLEFLNRARPVCWAPHPHPISKGSSKLSLGRGDKRWHQGWRQSKWFILKLHLQTWWFCLQNILLYLTGD